MDYLQAADEGTLFWFENHHTPWLNSVMQRLTDLGEGETLMPLLLIVGIGYFLWKLPRTAAIVLIMALLAYTLTANTKRIVSRPRPDVAWVLIPVPTNMSFPSGHALNTMAIFGAIALTLARRLHPRPLRWFVLAIGFLLPLLIGISRVYLGVHYPSDVIGGWTAGVACALLAYWADVRWGERRGVVLPTT